MKYIVSGVLAVGMSACVTLDEKKPANSLEVLNGEKYSSVGPAVALGPIPLSGPFVTRTNSNSQLYGKIVRDQAGGYHQSPFKFKTVLLKHGETIYRTSTDEHGAYRFAENIKDGSWTLSLKDCPETRSVEVKGYETNANTWVILCPKSNPQQPTAH